MTKKGARSTSTKFVSNCDVKQIGNKRKRNNFWSVGWLYFSSPDLILSYTTWPAVKTTAQLGFVVKSGQAKLSWARPEVKRGKRDPDTESIGPPQSFLAKEKESVKYVAREKNFAFLADIRPHCVALCQGHRSFMDGWMTDYSFMSTFQEKLPEQANS